MPRAVTDVKPLAWGGIELAVPRDWEPGRVGRDHLVFESDAGPTMEIKWAPGGGRLAGGRPVARLARAVRRQGGTLREHPLTTAWQRALAGREGSAFEWDAGGRRAAGVCVRCRECGTVSLIQFFGRWPGWEEQAACVLSSLLDHRSGERTRWRLFDISAELSNAFRLVESRFRPGRFELRFRQARLALTLWRWAPAGALLQGKTLPEFAGTALGAAGLQFEPAAVNEFAGAAAADPLPAGIVGRLATWLGRARPRAARVWHVPGCNRILGVQLQGPAREVDSEMERICRCYGVDDPTQARTDAGRP
jgi:hypothetical protein